MKTSSGLILSLLAVALLSTVVMTAEAQAECKIVSGTPTYTAGQLKDLTCDTSGLLQTNATTSFGTATAAAPTRIEGASATFSFNLAGAARFTMDTLLSGEDQTNNLLMTSGGVVRMVTVASAITTNTISTSQVIPTGNKTLFGRVDGTGMVGVTLDIWGGFESAASKTGKVWICSLNLIGVATAVEICPTTVKTDFPYYIVESTLINGTSASAQVLAAE